ncbi:AAA family ATPase [Peribacillus frigoritolerans]
MRLKSIYIEKYKQIKNFTINFNNIEQSVGKEPFRFFIGKNGAGKTSLLEGIGLIFTRVLQDETPGFNFEIKYIMSVNEKDVTITVRPNQKSPKGKKNEETKDLVSRLQVFVETETNDLPKRLDLRKRPFSQCTEYHPRRIIACASGPTNIFEDVFLKSPEDSIKSDIYDAREGTNEKTDYDQQMLEIDQSLINLKKLYDNSTYLFIDGETSKFIILALCAFTPLYDALIQDSKKSSYINLRKSLLDMTGGLKPLGFSLVVDEKKLNLFQSTEVPSNLKMIVDMVSTNDEPSDNMNNYQSWSITRQKVINDSSRLERVAYFPILGQESFIYHCPGLQSDINPFDLIALFIIAKRDGLLIDAHVFFQKDEHQGVLDENALSDGEYLWLGRMGLVLLSRENSNGDMLFLFDEPDVHLNESWNEQFVELLHQLSKGKKNKTSNDFIIATHSTLLLTDADPSQLYLLEKENKEVPRIVPLSISTFAANRAEISQRIFGTKQPIGQYSMRLLEEKFERNNKSELVKLLDKVGPGYYRYRVQNKLLDLEFIEKEKGENNDITTND